MPRELPPGYKPTADELLVGKLWQAAADLNAIVQEVAVEGITVELTLGRSQSVASKGDVKATGWPLVFVDACTRAKVRPVWFVDRDGRFLPHTYAPGEMP